MGAVVDEVVYVSRIYLLLGCWGRGALGGVLSNSNGGGERVGGG